MIPVSELLAQGRPVELDRALALSIALAAELARLHGLGCSPVSCEPEGALWDGEGRATFASIREWAGEEPPPAVAADLRALGALLYQVFTGARWTVAAPPPRRLNREVSIKLQTALLRAAASAPPGAYVSAAALLEDLRELIPRARGMYTAHSGLRPLQDPGRRHLDPRSLSGLKGARIAGTGFAGAAGTPAAGSAGTPDAATGSSAGSAGTPAAATGGRAAARAKELALAAFLLLAVAATAALATGRLPGMTPANRGDLTVYSIPVAARVLVDGTYVGQAPILRYRLPAGQHVVAIKADDYFQHEASYLIEAGKETTVSIGLAPMPGSLRLTSEPSGAQIIVDGVLAPGKLTPCVVENIAVGPHTVKLRKSGHEDREQTVTVKPNTQTLLVWGLTSIRATTTGPVQEEPIEVGYNNTRGPEYRPYDLKANLTLRFPLAQAKNIGFRILAVPLGLERGTPVPALIYAVYPDGVRRTIWDIEYALESVRFLDGGGAYQVVPGVYAIHAELTVKGRVRRLSTKIVVETD
jgi:hypothetical protein